MYERLIKCGFTAQMAQDICILYADDPQGLLREKRVRLHCPCDL